MSQLSTSVDRGPVDARLDFVPNRQATSVSTAVTTRNNASTHAMGAGIPDGLAVIQADAGNFLTGPSPWDGHQALR